MIPLFRTIAKKGFRLNSTFKNNNNITIINNTNFTEFIEKGWTSYLDLMKNILIVLKINTTKKVAIAAPSIPNNPINHLFKNITARAIAKER